MLPQSSFSLVDDLLNQWTSFAAAGGTQEGYSRPPLRGYLRFGLEVLEWPVWIGRLSGFLNTSFPMTVLPRIKKTFESVLRLDFMWLTDFDPFERHHSRKPRVELKGCSKTSGHADLRIGKICPDLSRFVSEMFGKVARIEHIPMEQ